MRVPRLLAGGADGTHAKRLTGPCHPSLSLLLQGIAILDTHALRLQYSAGEATESMLELLACLLTEADACDVSAYSRWEHISTLVLQARRPGWCLTAVYVEGP